MSLSVHWGTIMADLTERVIRALELATIYSVRRNKLVSPPYEVFECQAMWNHDKTVIVGSFHTHDEAEAHAKKLSENSEAEAVIALVLRDIEQRMAEHDDDATNIFREVAAAILTLGGDNA